MINQEEVQRHWSGVDFEHKMRNRGVGEEIGCGDEFVCSTRVDHVLMRIEVRCGPSTADNSISFPPAEPTALHSLFSPNTAQGLASRVCSIHLTMTTPHVITSSSPHPSQSSTSHGIVGNHYRVGKKIGEGSFGVVFEGL
jgi:hypothetical protein